MFCSKNKKKRFYYIKVGFKGVYITQNCLAMFFPYFCNVFHTYFQYTRDNTNQEAFNNLQLIQPLEQDIAHAKQLFEQQEYNGAIQLLSRAVEVGN